MPIIYKDVEVEVELDIGLDDFDDSEILEAIRDRNLGAYALPMNQFYELVSRGEDDKAIDLMYHACAEQLNRVPLRPMLGA